MTVDDFFRASRSFPAGTAATWDGFHPRHYGMISEAQAAVVLRIYRLMERVGVTPVQLRGVFGKPIPKHKPGVARVSLRSIGLLPCTATGPGSDRPPPDGGRRPTKAHSWDTRADDPSWRQRSCRG